MGVGNEGPSEKLVGVAIEFPGLICEAGIEGDEETVGISVFEKDVVLNEDVVFC